MASIRARTDNGLLFFDFRFNGVRCREQTTLEDTKANRQKMEKVLKKIEECRRAFKFTQVCAMKNDPGASAC